MRGRLHDSLEVDNLEVSTRLVEVKGFQMEKIGLVVDSQFTASVTGLSLKELQTAVDGLIQPIDIREGLTMWVNEEFLFRAEPDENVLATAFFAEAGGKYDIHGTVVFTGGTDEDGNTLGLSDEHRELVESLCKFGVGIRAMA